QETDTLLVYDASESLQRSARRQRKVVQDRVVFEAARHERADPAAAEDVIQQEGRLSQRAALLKLPHLEVLEAGESARLHIAPAVDETDVELAFFAPGIVHEFALRLHGALAVTAEGREVLAAAVKREVAGPPRAE